MKFGGRRELTEKMQAALDRLLDILTGHRFGRIVTDATGRTQKNHCGRNCFSQDHGIVARAAYHPVRIASGLNDRTFYFANEKRIHRD
jgi:hypothetical protein